MAKSAADSAIDGWNVEVGQNKELADGVRIYGSLSGSLVLVSAQFSADRSVLIRSLKH